MKPSEFILNSDYLSIAQVGSKTYDLTIGAGSITLGNYTEQNIDFQAQAIAGAVSRVMIAKDGGNYRLGSSMTFYPTSEIRGDIQVFRQTASTIRVKVTLQNYGQGTSSYPSMTFKIKVSSFMPPNVF